MTANSKSDTAIHPRDGEPAATDRDVVFQGDAAVVCARFPAEYAQTIITSPPYFGHREYSDDESLAKNEIGRESSLDRYVTSLVGVFSVLLPVLKDDGTLWLNLGDTYRNGELLGVPWRVALALKDAGFVLRSEIIWNKPNAMPSSVKTRPTTSHEHVFLFSKRHDYFYNADAIREPHVTFSAESKMCGGRNHFGRRGGTPERGKNGGNSNLHTARWDQAFHPLGRNKRTVWDIPLGKYKGSHFAVFPEKLVELCLLASTRAEDVALDPFAGSGTVGVVARRLGRHFVGVELIPSYVALARKRLSEAALARLPFDE